MSIQIETDIYSVSLVDKRKVLESEEEKVKTDQVSGKADSIPEITI